MVLRKKNKQRTEDDELIYNISIFSLFPNLVIGSGDEF